MFHDPGFPVYFCAFYSKFPVFLAKICKRRIRIPCHAVPYVDYSTMTIDLQFLAEHCSCAVETGI